jgi:hypothetical protein
MSPKRYGQLAAVLFAAEAIFAIVHLALGAKYPHFTHSNNVVIDLLLAIVWTAAAVASLMPQTWPAPFVMMCGAALSAMQGFMFTVSTNDVGPVGVGLPFFAAAAVQFYCTFHAAPPLTPVVPQPASARHRWRAWALRLRHTH